MTARVLDGRAAIYRVPHQYKGRTEIFEPGAFAGSLSGVFFTIDHDLRLKPLGDTDDDTLELFDDDVALHCRLKIQPGHIEKLGGRSELSCSYIEHDVVFRDGLRVIRKCSLVEISACHVASLRQSHCIVRDASKVGPLADDAKTCFESDSAAVKFMDALRRYDT